MRRRCAITGERLPLFWQLGSYESCERVLRVGLPGSGKSLLTVLHALRLMRAGYRVWANFALTDRVTGQRAGLCESWDAFIEVCELPGRDKVVVLQEVNLLCSSREWGSLPLQVHKAWAQVRHYGVTMLMDAQHEARVDKVMREILDHVVICEATGWRRGVRVPLLDVPLAPKMPLYRETWATPETVAQCRTLAAQQNVAGAHGEELNVVPPGDVVYRWVPGYVHTCYKTHEVLEPWRYNLGEGRGLEPPECWDGEGWKPQVGMI